MHGMKHFETGTSSQQRITEIVIELLGLMKKAELRNKEDHETRQRRKAALKPDEAATPKSTEKAHHSALSRSFSKLRKALPGVSTSKEKEVVAVPPVKEETSPWSMFLSSTDPPKENASSTCSTVIWNPLIICYSSNRLPVLTAKHNLLKLRTVSCNRASVQSSKI